jgi:hypothetical protein
MTLAEWIKRRLKEMCQGWPVWQPLTKEGDGLCVRA